MKQKELFKELFATPKKVVIIPHIKPDADALGSSLGLCIFLKYLGHNAVVISPSNYPEFLRWMPGESDIICFSQKTQPEVEKHFSEADLVICVDFCALQRSRLLEPFIQDFQKTTLLIDHHMDKENVFDGEWWDENAAATAQLVYEMIGFIEPSYLKDQDIMACLYAGIITDTGNFKYMSTSAETHRIAMEMKNNELNTTRIQELVYDSNSLNRIQLLGYALTKLHVHPEYHTAYISLSFRELDRFKYQVGDTEGIVNYALSIQGIHFAAIFIQIKRGTKVSFRSQGSFSVSNFAARHFCGGGHHSAAGGVVNTQLSQTIKRFLAILPEYQEALDY